MNDYDAGLLNDWGGGNVDWWHDYLRYELGLANEYWAAQVQANESEIDRLRAELAALVNLRAEADSAWDSATYNAERARKAEAELAACREDADRYRHVRANPAMLLHLSNKAFDDAIDAARKGEETK